MKILFILVFTITVVSGCTRSHFQKADILVTGTAEPVISLNGTWKFTVTPPENFFKNEVSCTRWNDILVPEKSGYILKPDTPYVYKSLFAIPSDYKGKAIKLRFESVDGSARVWVNGAFIANHAIDMATWDCDITQNVEPGTSAWLTIEVTTMDNKLSVTDRHVKQHSGGISGSVSLLALPENHPKAITVRTRFDSKYKDADLSISVASSGNEKTWVGFRLYDPEGKQIRLNDKRYLIKGDTLKISFPVKNPAKSDAVHPNQYTLITEVFNKSILTASVKTKIGFSVTELKGN